MKIKKGDRFSVYQIVDGGDYAGRFTNGTLRVGYPGNLRTLVNVLGADGIFYFLMNHAEVRKVGEVKINRVK